MKLFSTLCLAASTASIAIASPATGTTSVHFVNKCPTVIELFDNHDVIPLQPGQAYDRVLPMGWMGMFRHGRNPQATLAEFTMAGGKAWFDLSIIPTAPGKGPDFCPSLNACKTYTGGTGFNVQMQITPKSGVNGANCREITCMTDGCQDAYQFPKDDTKTHNCPYGTDFDLTFCPGGTGGITPAPTTPAPTTSAPTTSPPLVQSDPGTVKADWRQAETNNSEGSHKSGSYEEVGIQESGQITNSPQEPKTTPTTESSKPVPVVAAPVVQANTKTSSQPGISVAGYVLLAAMAVVVTMVAAFAVVLRRKKQLELEALESKTDFIMPSLASV